MLAERIGGMTADELEMRMGSREWIEWGALDVIREEEGRFAALDAKGRASLKRQMGGY